MSFKYSGAFRVGFLCLTIAVLAVPARADSVFGDPLPLNTNASTDVELDGQPAVAADGAGNLVAVWSSSNLQDNGIGNDGDIFESHSSDGGVSWSDPAALTTDDAADQSPAIATDGAGNWVVVWSSDNDLGGSIGTDYDLLFTRSTNNGTSWSTPTFLNSLAPTSNASDVDVSVAAGGPDLFVAAWDSNANVGAGTDTDIHYARSKDGGASWGDEAALNPDATTDSLKFDQTPGLVSDGQGNWVAFWLGDGQDSVYDVLMARSTNDGKSWKNQKTVGSGSGQPRIATDGAGHWTAVWHLLDASKGLADDDNDILVSTSADTGSTWTTPDFVNSNADTDAHNDQKPSIATDRNGTWLVTWSSTNPLDGSEPSDFDIHRAFSKNNGETWSSVKPLHSNADTDLGTDINSVTLATGVDSWFVAWESYEPFTDLGSDADIVFARAFPSSYTIVTPNGGESWKIGRKGRIEWQSTAKAGKVRLILLKDGASVATIKNKTDDDGLFKWEVPAGVGTGSNFRVRIEAKGDSSDADESDANFKIKSGK